MLFDEMVVRGLKPDDVTYTSLIDGFMRQGEVFKALRIKDEIMAHGLP